MSGISRSKCGNETSSLRCRTPVSEWCIASSTPQLVARLDYFQDQQKGPITRAEFLARASKLANEKARELGWLV
jgi:hypothetical protein